MSGEDFLSRWSRRKHQARKAEAIEEAPSPVEPAQPASSAPAALAPQPVEEPPLPPLESLTPESDFTPFMRPKVDPQTRTQALKTLFQDPRFNVMDGLDVYIDDYSKPDPLPEGWLEKMNQVTRLGAYVPPVEESVEGGANREAALPAEPSGAEPDKATDGAEEETRPEEPEDPIPPAAPRAQI